MRASRLGIPIALIAAAACAAAAGADSQTATPAGVTAASVTHSWTVRGGRTRVVSLAVSGIAPASASVTVLCHGPGCPFATKSVAARGGRANLAGLFGRRTLGSGANVAIVVVAPGTTGRYVSFDTRPAAVPSLKAGCAASGYVTTPNGGGDIALLASANAQLTVAQLVSVPAGRYLVLARATAAYLNGPSEAVRCFVRAGGATSPISSIAVGTSSGYARFGDVSVVAMCGCPYRRGCRAGVRWRAS